VEAVAPIRALMARAIDYAGLFPPASLELRAAVNDYSRYVRSPESWMLGAFVIPARRLAELSQLAPKTSERGPWVVSAIGGDDCDADMAAIRAVPKDSGISVRMYEARATTIAEVERIAAAANAVRCFVELPSRDDPAALIESVATHGLSAKIRTGGVTADAFPSPPDIARFMVRCAESRVAFKATAGLHHPMRGRFPLTYAPDAARDHMFGFLNVLVAATAVRNGASIADATAILERERPEALSVDERSIHWDDLTWAVAEVEDAREHAIVSFGSCSFEEPVRELTAMRLLR